MVWVIARTYIIMDYISLTSRATFITLNEKNKIEGYFWLKKVRKQEPEFDTVSGDIAAYISRY